MTTEGKGSVRVDCLGSWFHAKTYRHRPVRQSNRVVIKINKVILANQTLANVPYCWIKPSVDLFIMGPLVSKDRNVGGGGVGVRQDDGAVFDRAVGPLGQQQRPMGPTIANKVALGGGCFWGVDHYITTRK
jgi:hypothetical protein